MQKMRIGLSQSAFVVAVAVVATVFFVSHGVEAVTLKPGFDDEPVFTLPVREIIFLPPEHPAQDKPMPPMQKTPVPHPDEPVLTPPVIRPGLPKDGGWYTLPVQPPKGFIPLRDSVR